MYKIKDGRLKPKPVGTFGKAKKPYKGKNRNRKGSVSDSDKSFLSWLQSSSYGCMVCGRHDGIEWHHVKLNSCSKKDHTKLIPLCGIEHHRVGTVLSAHGTPKKFRETYSIEYQEDYALSIFNEYLS